MSLDVEDLIKKLAPDDQAKADEGFKSTLQFKLVSQISKLEQGKQNSTINYPNFMNKFSSFVRNFGGSAYGGKFVLPLAALAVIIIAVVVAVPKGQNSKVTLLGKQEITRLSANGFGQLNSVNLSGGRGQGGANANASAGSQAAVSSDAKMIAPAIGMPAIGIGGGGVGMPSEIYQPMYYKYVYKGDAFTVENDQMDVFEREKGFGGTADLSSFLSQFSVGLFDASKFQNATVDYIRAAENRDQGYAIDMDLKLGTLYIGQNWEKWAVMDYSQPVSMDQVPSDESAINIANRFLDEYGISRENYGEPEVQNLWRGMYERSTQMYAPEMYVPDMVTVIYPTKISGNEIYDESGNKNGMYVYINVRNNKVSSAGEITGQKYNASAYPTEKDTARLIQIAENGGQRSYMPFAAVDSSFPNIPSIKEQEVELGTPKIVYVRMWQTLNNQSKDIFVPSLMFPIMNKPADLYQQSITVPLIKEVLDSQQKQPIPMPLPIEKLLPMTEPAM